MAAAPLVQQQGAVSSHGDQYIAGAPCLQLGGAGADILFLLQGAAEQLAQLQAVGLDEEGVVGQGAAQQVPGGVHHKLNPPIFQPGQDLLVHVVRQGGRHRAGDHQDIPGLQSVQLILQRPQSHWPDGRTLAVDLSLVASLDLDIDAGQPIGKPDEVGADALAPETLLQGPAGEAGQETKCYVFHTQGGQHGGHIDALAAVLDLLLLGAVDLARTQSVHPNHIVQSGIKGYCIDHTDTSLIMVCSR